MTSHDLYPPSPCHKVSHFLRPPPPLWSVTYFMDGPKGANSVIFTNFSTLESTTVTDFSLLVRSTCLRSYSLSFAPPPDMFCSSHIVRLFLTLCDSSCTGSRCQIMSSSNCVCWYTDACTDSLLTICPISAHPPRCSLS